MKKYINQLIWLAIFVAFSILIVAFYKGGFKNWREGLDLAGWVRLLYRLDFSEYEKTFKDPRQLVAQKNNVVQIVTRNIDSRISKLWVSDYSARRVSLNNVDYIEVQIWWIEDVDYAKKMIWKTVEMIFKVPFDEPVTDKIKAERKLLAEKILLTAVNSWFNLASALYADNVVNRWLNIVATSKVLKENELKDFLWLSWQVSFQTWQVYWKLVKDSQNISEWNNLKTVNWWGIVSILNITETKLWTGENLSWYSITWNIQKEYTIWEIFVAEKPAWKNAVYKNKLLNWERFKMATTNRWPNWQPVVDIYFDETWKKVFCEMTKKYLHKQMAIFIWNKIVSAPVIQDEICGWVAMISWNYTWQEAEKFAEELNTWAMPVPLKLEQEEKVSPKLWQSALKNAIIAGWVWFVLIFVLFYIMYWMKKAVVTVITLIWFFAVLWMFIKIFGVVLSLSGIGAVLLNIGMAVDANVIIYERIKEEKEKWKSIIQSIMDWYTRSLSAIRDGNVTTGLIALLLFTIWTNMFKWFGTMMLISIFITLFVVVPMIPGLLIVFEKNK